MNNKIFVVITVALAAIFFGVVAMKNSTPSDKPNEVASNLPKAEPISAEKFVRAHSPRMGNSMARVVVVEWLDPECEACRAMHPLVKKIVADYGDRAMFVVRFMPYHGGSMYAASALFEAQEQGKFDQALTTLFDKQPEWGDHSNPRSDLIPSYLTKLGIPAKSLDKRAVVAKHGHKVKIDQDDGEAVGVKGTPSFYVNQKPLGELGEQQLRAMIEAELAAATN